MKPTSRLAPRLATPVLLAGCLAFAACGQTPKTGPDEPVQKLRTLAQADALMESDGSLQKYILTKQKGDKRVTPKHPDKAFEWFMSARVAPGERTLPPHYREEALAETLRKNMDRSKLLPQSARNTWSHIVSSGATAQPSGRMVELVVDPGNDQIVYAASASGGVWRTGNRGSSWTNLTDDDLPSMGMGALAMDPTSSTTLYAGMGEGVPGSNLFEPFGAGVYKTTNSGTDWAMVPNTGNFQFVTDIAVGETSNTLFVTAKGNRAFSSTGGGFWRTTDGGANWTKTISSSAYSISVDPTSRALVVVGEGMQTNDNMFVSSWAGIKYSTDGGATWNVGYPKMGQNNNNAGRIELTRNGNTMYAIVAHQSGTILNLLKSTDGGQNWAILPQTGIAVVLDAFGNVSYPAQHNYNCSIQVSPHNANTVYLGSNLRSYKSTNGGTSWTPVSWWDVSDPGTGPYMHADHHSIRFGANNNTVYFGCDGGFFFTTNGGTSWTEANNNYDGLQIYRIHSHKADASAIIIGTQDNDKYVRRSNGTWHHNPNTFGDCMPVIAYEGNANTYFGANYNTGAVAVTTNGGTSWSYSVRGYGASNNGIPDNESGPWVPAFFNDAPYATTTLYLSCQHLYQATYTAGMQPAWNRIITLPGNPSSVDRIMATPGPMSRRIIGVLDPSRFGTGTNALNRFFFANMDGTGFTQRNLPQVGWVNGLAGDFLLPDRVWIGYSNITTPTSSTGNTNQNMQRVYMSDNMGMAWTNMTNNLPQNLPVNCIFVDPMRSETVIIGTDIGVYRSDDAGMNWIYWSDNLPKVVVNDFSFYPPTRKLRAGTYGRGIWEVTVTGPPDIHIDPTDIAVP